MRESEVIFTMRCLDKYALNVVIKPGITRADPRFLEMGRRRANGELTSRFLRLTMDEWKRLLNVISHL